jgi:hypothetical protein
MRDRGQMVDMVDPVEGAQDGIAVEDRALYEFSPLDRDGSRGFVEYPNPVPLGAKRGHNMPPDEAVSACY